MSRSDDPGHYFRTSDALATSERKAAKAKNKEGDPVKLPSKILAVCNDAAGGIYVAEAAGQVKHIALETKKITPIFTQGTAPLTCLALGPGGRTLYTGSWDKNIYAIDLQDTSKVTKLQSHTDFIKCLLVANLDGRPILLSGSADATIIIWDLETRRPLHKLKGHTKALQDLAIDPLSFEKDSFTLFSASSDREIRQWHISLSQAHELEQDQPPILAHETSIYKLRFDADGDLWTASADKTAKHLVRDRNWESDTTLEHSDFVRDVLPIEEKGLVVTACRDEEVRIWDIASGKIMCTYSGHFEEITGLARIRATKVVSVSIDGTVRQWSLDSGDMQRYGANGREPSTYAVQQTSLLTEEEERELAALEAELELSDDD